MPLRNTVYRWGAIAQLFHWTIVALIVVQFVLINMASRLPLGLQKVALLAQHKSFGITILGLAIIRLVWRLLNTAPPLPPTLKPYERVLAHGTHWGLYILLFTIPLSGWAMSSARNFPVSWFKLVQLPDFVQPNKAMYAAMQQTHEILTTALLVVVALHVLGALKHHFILKDDVLRRMLPFTRTK